MLTITGPRTSDVGRRTSGLRRRLNRAVTALLTTLMVATALAVIAPTAASAAVVTALPGRIQAEDYVGFSDIDAGNQGRAGAYVDDVDVWPTTGGGFILGRIREGEYTTYDVSVAEAGTYEFEMRNASGGVGGLAMISVDGVPIAPATDLGNTNGWWRFRSTSLGEAALSMGAHTVRVDWGPGQSNFDHLDVRLVETVSGTVDSPVASALPGTIAAENYASFRDTSSGNSGTATGFVDDVDVWTMQGGSGFILGDIAEDEFTTYELDVAEGGVFNFDLVHASGAAGSTATVSVNGIAIGAPAALGNTGGWWSFQKTAVGQTVLNAGRHTLRVDWGSGQSNFARIDVTAETGAQGEVLNAPVAAVPGIVQAEDYKHFGDLDSGNRGKASTFTDDVDVWPMIGGGYILGRVLEGEYTTYQVSVPTTGDYEFQVRHASGGAGGTATVSVDGTQIAPATALGNTNGWWRFADSYLGQTNLAAGIHTVRVDWGVGQSNVDHFEIVEATAPPPIDLSTPVGAQFPAPQWDGVGVDVSGTTSSAAWLPVDDPNVGTYQVQRTFGAGGWTQAVSGTSAQNSYPPSFNGRLCYLVRTNAANGRLASQWSEPRCGALGDVGVDVSITDSDMSVGDTNWSMIDVALTNTELASVQLELRYDPTVLKPLDCTVDNCNPVSAGVIRLAAYNSDLWTDDFQIGGVNFEAIGPGSTDLEIVIEEAADSVSWEPEVTSQDGAVGVLLAVAVVPAILSLLGRAQAVDGAEEALRDLADSEVRGDVSCDDDVNVLDALLVARFSVGLEVDNFGCFGADSAGINAAAGDMNGSGETNIQDAYLIASCSVGLVRSGCVGSISGVVSNDAGNGVAGIEACATSSVSGDRRCASTAADGSYTVAGLLDAADYYVEFDDPEQRFAGRCYPSAVATCQDAGAVSVAPPNDVTGIDVTVQCATGVEGYRCADPTLEPAWYGTTFTGSGYVTIDWLPITGADTYDVRWTVDGEPSPSIGFGLANSTGSLPLGAGPHQVCAEIRGYSAAAFSAWSPPTCTSYGSVAPAVLGSPTVVVGTSVTYTWVPGGGDSSTVAVHVDGQRVGTGSLTVGATSVVIPITPANVSVCVTVTETSWPIDASTSDCVYLHDGDIVPFERGPSPAEPLPTNPDGSLQFTADGAVAGSFAAEDFRDFKCYELPEGYPILRPGDRLKGTAAGNSATRLFGYMWEPNGWRVAGAGTVETIEASGTSINWWFYPLAEEAVYQSDVDENPVRTIVGGPLAGVTLIDGDLLDGVSLDGADDPADYQSGEYSPYNPYLWVDVPGQGEFASVIYRQGFNSANWTIEYDVELTELVDDPRTWDRPQAPEPCTYFGDISNFLAERPTGFEIIADALKDQLIEGCDAGPNAGNLQLVRACAERLGEALIQFAPGYDCFQTIKKIVNEQTPTKTDVAFCAFDGLGPALDAIRATSKVNVVARNADNVPLGAIAVNGDELADAFVDAADGLLPLSRADELIELASGAKPSLRAALAGSDELAELTRDLAGRAVRDATPAGGLDFLLDPIAALPTTTLGDGVRTANGLVSLPSLAPGRDSIFRLGAFFRGDLAETRFFMTFARSNPALGTTPFKYYKWIDDFDPVTGKAISVKSADFYNNMQSTQALRAWQRRMDDAVDNLDKAADRGIDAVTRGDVTVPRIDTGDITELELVIIIPRSLSPNSDVAALQRAAINEVIASAEEKGVIAILHTLD